jgi:hypothetical protein
MKSFAVAGAYGARAGPKNLEQKLVTTPTSTALCKAQHPFSHTFRPLPRSFPMRSTGTRLLQHHNSNLHHHQLHQETQAPVAAAVRHVQHPALLQKHNQLQQKQQNPATAGVTACYAAAMPASLSSTWSYDADDAPAAAGMNGGGFNRSNQLFVSGDDGFSTASISNSDEYESFGSSDTASLPSSDDASSCTGSDSSADSYAVEQQLRSSSSSSSSAAFWLSPSALQQLEESWSQQGSSYCMAGHECR